MKKLLVVLLSLGLIVAFGATASAADVKFGGSYYLVGVYEDNATVSTVPGASKQSQALFYTRTRLQPVFQVAEGLSFTVRLDALEKQWGQTDGKGGFDDLTATRGNAVPARVPRRGIQESVEFERAYVTFMTRIGMFQVGYQNVDDWGTDYSDFSNTRPRIAYVTKAGPVEIAFTYEKVFEADSSLTVIPGTAVTYGGTVVDADDDTYALSATYKGKGMEAGLLYKYYVNNHTRPSANAAATVGAKQRLNQVSPYVKATFGPVYIEGEFQYWFGKAAEFESPIGGGVVPAGLQDVDLKAWGAYLKGRFNFGPAYAGAAFAYSTGDDLSDPTKSTAKPGGAGTNFAPALLLMNDAFNTWTAGSQAASPAPGLAAVPAGSARVGTNPVTSSKLNAIIYNAFIGANPTPKLNVELGLTYATVDKKALYVDQVIATGVRTVTEADSDKLGTELDIKATYKIYDNLSYMVGAGYLWAGDYFRGATPVGGVPRAVENDYILLNQLTLAF